MAVSVLWEKRKYSLPTGKSLATFSPLLLQTGLQKIVWSLKSLGTWPGPSTSVGRLKRRKKRDKKMGNWAKGLGEGTAVRAGSVLP